MAITDSQKVQIRRLLGYPAAGLYRVSPAGGTLANAAAGYRFFKAYGFLEYKMNALAPSEEAALLGTAVGGIALIGAQPSVGDTMSVTLTGAGLSTPQTIVVTAPTPQPNIDGRLTMCNLLASAISINAACQTAGVYASTPYGTGPYAQNAVPLPEIGIVGQSAFTMTASGTGATYPSITSQGNYVPPSASLDGATTLYGYLPILTGLESAYAGASQNLDTQEADVWKGRSNELGQRMSQLEIWTKMMSDFLGIPINPDVSRGRTRRGAMRFA
jgi:hypothetical protein